MYTNCYKQIWSKQFYFQSRKNEISPYIFHRWIWQQAMCGIYMCRAVLCLVTQLHLTLCNPLDCSPPGSSVHGDSLGRNTGVGCHSLLQGIFPTQGSNPGLLHCSQVLYHLSHQKSPRILKWVAYPFSSGSSHPKNETGVSCTTGRFFTSWTTREAQIRN